MCSWSASAEYKDQPEQDDICKKKENSHQTNKELDPWGKSIVVMRVTFKTCGFHDCHKMDESGMAGRQN